MRFPNGKRRRLPCFGGAGLFALLISLAGCHSAFINAAVVNRSGRPVKLIEVDYPSASFGTGQLAAGSIFKYRFKVLGSGGTTITWTDVLEKDHTAHGPNLTEGQEGDLTLTIGPESVTWKESLRP